MDVGNFVVVPIVCGSFVWGLCFLTCFQFSNHLDKEESWLLHLNYFVDICVPCTFLKVQWVSQESEIVTFPSHVHLYEEDVCWQSRQHHSFMNIY